MSRSDDDPRRPLPSSGPSTRLVGGYDRRSPAELSGEHRLMLAILEDALSLYVKSVSEDAVALPDAREARVWLASRDRSLPFTFECICDVLGFDSGYIRRGLRTVRAAPAEAASRFSARHHGRRSGPATAPPTAPEVASRVA